MANPPQYRPRLTGNPANDEALRIAFNHIYTLQSQINDLSTSMVTTQVATPVATTITSSGGGGSGTNQIATDFVILTGGGTQTITYPAPITSVLLIVVVTEDVTGGTNPAWGAMFSTNTPTNINTEANKTTVFMFVGKGSIWQYASLAA